MADIKSIFSDLKDLGSMSNKILQDLKTTFTTSLQQVMHEYKEKHPSPDQESNSCSVNQNTANNSSSSCNKTSDSPNASPVNSKPMANDEISMQQVVVDETISTEQPPIQMDKK
ncbi:MAG: hypothetical protein ACOVQX_07395 [Legionella sp.]